jgi:O-antigen ligase
VGVSLFFAVLQFLHIGIGWSVFDFFTRFETRAVSDDEFYDIHERAMGLSYSPVLLGEQLCLAFAVVLALLILRDGDLRMFRRIDWRVIAASVVLAFGCVVSGNRSPLLGLMVFLALYTLVVRPAVGIAALVALAVAMPLLQNFLDGAAETGLRIANTDNSSSEGRSVLTAYGLQLFLSNPLGYGVAFDSTSYWQYYWAEFRDYENAGAIAQHALHNYYLMILNKNGIFSLVVVPFILWMMWRRRFAAMLFVPYLVHANYHNDGPLQGDFLLWYILPIFSLLPTRRLAPAPRRRAAPAPAYLAADGLALRRPVQG